MSVINREDAIKELMSWLPKLENGLIHWTGVKAMLENLPAVNPDGWISVEDRLPEYGEAVLAYFKDDDCNVNHIIDDETGEWLYDGVIAWMPIPSYKPKEDNKC